ncbi:MAG: nucleoside triphosphate pyrophosphatase [Aliishimia sp.]
MSIHMILASGSEIRATMLRQSRLSFSVSKPFIDEHSIKESLLAEDSTPRDIADCLAEAKAKKISAKNPGVLVLGCDQVLDLNGTLLSKPATENDAKAQLRALSGERHQLLSAAVICEDGKPIWRHIGKVTLRMHTLSDTFINAYVERNWDSIKEAVGSYKLEEEGVRLFSRIDGDYFNVLGLPLVELLNYLVLRGDLET